MIDLVKLVKENLPNNVSLTREPYKAVLNKRYLLIHGYIGYVFHIRTVLSDDSFHEEMLFVSESKNRILHNAISLVEASIDELVDRCYWVGENDIGLKYESPRICTKYNQKSIL